MPQGTKKGYAKLAGNSGIDALYTSQSTDTSASAHTPVNSTIPAGENLTEGKSNPASAGGSHITDAPLTARILSASAPDTFDYLQFYNGELDKKHSDKSYRYFNNINRLAAKFPVAHTGKTNEEVDVWCANDYLGMGRNPAVLDTMQ